MANPSRKMCTMRRIDKVEPIEGADRIEAYVVGGWVVVDGKGAHKEGDYVLYYEIDTFLPTADPRYAAFAERGEKSMTYKGKKNPVTGHVLKTIRLRGVYSQGLIMDPHDIMPDVPESAYQKMYESKAKLDGIAGVCEYVPYQNAMAAGFIAKYDPFVAPRTDAERIQNIDQETFDIVKRTNYFTSVKVDGTSITMTYDERKASVRAFSHNNEFDVTQGQGKLVMDTAEKLGIDSYLVSMPWLTLQMELCGPKIGGNTLGLKDHRLFVFSAWNKETRTYVNPYDLACIRNCVTPLLDIDLNEFDTPADLLAYAEGMRGNVTKDRLDEGLVVHIVGCDGLSQGERLRLSNELGSTMQVKAVSNKFLAKKKG